MFELLMLAAFLYAGLVHLLPPEKQASDLPREVSGDRAMTRPHSPPRTSEGLPRHRSSARLGKSGRLC